MEHFRQTTYGPVQGIAGGQPGVSAFLGIRYAKAARWQYPAMVESWDGVYDATHYGPCCIQERTYRPEETSNRPFYYNEFRKGVEYTYSEDCQVLNIWAPDAAQNAPVLVYLHGGAFLGGSAQEKCFDGAALSAQGLVVVTVNFRLGPLGYAAFPELAARDGRTGNYGMYDALAALQWVHNHIADFSGDPANVTLMGQSAGARMVQMLCISPLVQGLVHKAVLCSGGGKAALFGHQNTVEEVYPLWQRVLQASGVKDFAEFEQLSAEQLYAAFGRCIGQDFVAMQAACCPVADGQLLPLTIEQAIPQKAWLKIPYIIGSTSEDLTPRDMCTAAQNWMAGEEQPCYRYHFSRQLPGDDAGAFHSADLWYWFGTLDACWRPFTSWDRDLSNAMVRYLAAFAATGKTEVQGLPVWPNNRHSAANDMLVLGDTEIKFQKINTAAIRQPEGIWG